MSDIGGFGIGLSPIEASLSGGIGIGAPIGEFQIGISAIGFVDGTHTDIKTIWNVENSCGDWVLYGRDLLSGDDLLTATFISFFSDKRARDDDVIPDGTDNKRGWWGDTDQPFTIGSRLWLLERAKLDRRTPGQAEEYAAEALQWMIAEGVILGAEVAARAVYGPVGKLFLAVILYKTDGTQAALNFAWVWNQTNAL